MSAHVPHRSSWDCLACAEPWPCDPAREELMTEMDTVRLATYMWEQLEEAVRGLPPTPAVETFERFIKWTG
ncbi:hypothetical protein AB0G04_25910 [Actinoplanes sp. NPDC023801]|uniref:hypothetical protein n=1 Tax=Actinoplanes sp. NPDC023801 TaxID=3154595 RepID=UPI0033D3D70F